MWRRKMMISSSDKMALFEIHLPELVPSKYKICVGQEAFNITVGNGGIVMYRHYQLDLVINIRIYSIFNCLCWLNILPNRMAIACLQSLFDSRSFASTEYLMTVFPPLFLDIAFQVPAVLTSYSDGFIAVPGGLKALSWYSQPAISERCPASIVLRHPRKSVAPANVVVTDQAGDVFAGLEGYRILLRLKFRLSLKLKAAAIGIKSNKMLVMNYRTGTKFKLICYVVRNGAVAPAFVVLLSFPPHPTDQQSTEVRNASLKETRTPRNLFKHRDFLNLWQKSRAPTQWWRNIFEWFSHFFHFSIPYLSQT